jgi:hypothetical protein
MRLATRLTEKRAAASIAAWLVPHWAAAKASAAIRGKGLVGASEKRPRQNKHWCFALYSRDRLEMPLKKRFPTENGFVGGPRRRDPAARQPPALQELSKAKRKTEGTATESLRRTMDDIRPRDPAWKQVPWCTLSQYREIVRDCPRPSNAQIENYVLAASEDHSWYKHLPLVPPGVPWWFFVDPMSGFDRTLKDGGRAEHVEVKADAENLGRRAPTSEYRSRFGHLACVTTGWGGFLPDGKPRVRFGDRDRVFNIPDEIAEAGRVEVTAVIHPATAQPWVWRRMFGKTGGDETLREIISHSERALKDRGMTDGIDDRLVALLAPEWRRQHEAMKDAIRSMLSVAYA